MSAPVAERPKFPKVYGISEAADGLLPWSWAEERLVSSRNYWLATTRPDGGPHAMPVWALWRPNGLVFSASPQSRKGRNLERDPRVAVHLESGDEVVVVEAVVEPTQMDDQLADDYKEKYGFRPTVPAGGSDPRRERPWYLARPQIAFAWVEQDFPQTATRFRFGEP